MDVMLPLNGFDSLNLDESKPPPPGLAMQITLRDQLGLYIHLRSQMEIHNQSLHSLMAYRRPCVESLKNRGSIQLYREMLQRSETNIASCRNQILEISIQIVR